MGLVVAAAVFVVVAVAALGAVVERDCRLSEREASCKGNSEET